MVLKTDCFTRFLSGSLYNATYYCLVVSNYHWILDCWTKIQIGEAKGSLKKKKKKKKLGYSKEDIRNEEQIYLQIDFN